MPSSEPVGFPKAGWSKVVLQDKVPLCVLAGNREVADAPFIDKVGKKQNLRAGSSVVFAAYAAGCINEACDDLPTLQCTVDREGGTLVVHSRYWGYHKDGASCATNCRPVGASCETQALEAGSYKVVYGDNTFTLKIPSTPREPCFVVK